MSTFRNKVAICNRRYDELLNDSSWKEIVYNKMDINHDVLSIIYDPIGTEGVDDLHYVNAYIQKNMKSRVYFYINKDVEGLMNAFSMSTSATEEDTIEG